MNINSFKSKTNIDVNGISYEIHRLKAVTEMGVGHVEKLPFSIKILLENLVRHEDGLNVTKDDIEFLAGWDPKNKTSKEISYMPARVILQDFTGVPCVVDLASMRDAVIDMGGDPSKINPLQQVDLVIDHSVQVDKFGGADAFKKNVEIEFQRNKERYSFLRWGQTAFKNFRVVPPGTGIVHQVNLEYLGQGVYSKEENGTLKAYPDTLIGTDSHTTMINALGVMGWGVGGIEAEAAMLGQPISMLIPDVIGFKVHGKLREGVTATDLVLTATHLLRKKGVVGKFVEFYGAGLSNLSLPDRATLANMSPEFGSTMGFFPVDEETLRYLKLTGRDQKTIDLVRAYTQEQGLFRSDDTPDPKYSDTVELDLGTVEPTIAGPKRPQDKISLSQAKASFFEVLPTLKSAQKNGHAPDRSALTDGSVVIAAITSCTNTSNPSVMIEAGLLARNAVQKGLKTAPWVKTSLAPGSKVVTDYLEKADLMKPLEALGFHLVGFGCTTCIGNSGPLPSIVEGAVKDQHLMVSSVLSGNRNFEGRIHPLVQANYLMSPPLVVAYALAGNMCVDITQEPLGMGKDGKPVYLANIWPTRKEVQDAIGQFVTAQQFKKEYSVIFEGDQIWKNIPIPKGGSFEWDDKSTYVRRASFLENLPKRPEPIEDIKSARVLALLGDSVTTDHISPAGSIGEDSPAGKYLKQKGVSRADFNSYGSRRGNHEVMVRGTFANIRLRNQLAPGTEGGFTKKFPEGTVTTIYEASEAYKQENTPLIVLAGKEYGSGSSRDWAAKGTKMLGIKAVIAESYERIHRSNLVMMGVLPLQFLDGQNIKSLGLKGDETFDIVGIIDSVKPLQNLIVKYSGSKKFEVKLRIDTPKEIDYYKHGGILSFVLRQIMTS